MAIIFDCECGKKLKAKDDLAGKKVKCPDCKKAVLVPKPQLNPDDDNFEDKYILNVTLIDYLLENKPLNPKRIKSAISYISQNFEQSGEFLTAYFISGKYLEVDLLSRLTADFLFPMINLSAFRPLL